MYGEYGIYVPYSQMEGYIYGDYIGGVSYDNEIFKVAPQTLGLFVGNIDGVDYYEGDIVIYKVRTYDKENCSYEYMDIEYIIKVGEYNQDGSWGEYPPYKCLGVYAEIMKNIILVDEYDEQKSLLKEKPIKKIGDIYNIEKEND